MCATVNKELYELSRWLIYFSKLTFFKFKKTKFMVLKLKGKVTVLSMTSI